MSIVRHSLHIATKQLAYFSIIIAAVFTLLIVSVYWLSDAIEQRQDEISNWVSDQIGYPVEIGSAGLNWLGFAPQLEVNTVTIQTQDKQKKLITLEQLYLGLDIVASLKQAEPVLNEITLNGMKLSLVRDEQGALTVPGFFKTTNGANDGKWQQWLSLIERINLYAITLDYQDHVTPGVSGEYHIRTALLAHDNYDWTSTINVKLAAHLGYSLQLNLENRFDSAFQLTDWQGQAKFNRIRLESLSTFLNWNDVSVKQGIVDSQITANGSGFEIENITTTVDLTEIKLQSQQSNSSMLVEQIKGQFDWHNDPLGWQLSGREMQINMDGERWQPTGFTVSKDQNDLYVLASQYLKLSHLTELALLSSQSPEFIRQQKPAGDVELLNIRYSAEQGLIGLSLQLKDAGLLPWQDYPGVTGLTGTVSWNEGLGNISLDSHKITLYPEQWLDDSVFFDSITGVINIQKTDQDWSVQTRALRVWNEDLTIQLDGNINQFSDDKTITDLELILQEVEVNQWKKYVPLRILSDDFRYWAKDAFLDGKIVDGKITLRGDLADFPYDSTPTTGVFDMALQGENLELHYGPDWPNLVGVKADIFNSGTTLVIDGEYGSISGFDFNNITTSISRFVLSNPILTMKGELKGTTQNALLFLQNSPLKDRFGSITELFSAKGDSTINLNLMVPLINVDATEATGNVQFINSELQSKSEQSLSLSSVNGRLNFNNDGVDAKAIKARLLESDVVIDVKPQQGETLISAKSDISLDKLRQLDGVLVPEFISGQTEYQLDISVSEKEIGDFYIDAILKSDLKGIEVDLPRPFTKAAGGVTHFQVSLAHHEDGLAYGLDYGEKINAIVMPKGDLWRGGVQFGQGEAELATNGIKIRGQLEQLSIDEWLAWSDKQTGQNSTLAASIDDISMTIDQLTGFEQQLTQLNISAQKDAQGWRTQLHSEQTKGFIYLPSSFEQTKLQVKLDNLLITLPEDEAESPQDNTEKMSLWPAMDVDITSLTINDIALGQLQLQATRTPTQWQVEHATLSSPVYSANLKGRWQQSAADDKTDIQLQANSDDLAALLTNFGYLAVIDAKQTAVDLNLSWPANPIAFKSEQLQGSLKLDVGKGKLTEVEPGAAGRIFGLLSVAAIPRRLSLDFSDLFSKGFSFSSITGIFELADGFATTENMMLQGESAAIAMTGPIDLVNKRYQQQVKITPNVSSTLPIAGAVAGGPIGLGVGAAILLVDKLADQLFDKNIVNVISYRYDLTGPWDDPQLSVIKLTAP